MARSLTTEAAAWCEHAEQKSQAHAPMGASVIAQSIAEDTVGGVAPTRDHRMHGSGTSTVGWNPTRLCS